MATNKTYAVRIEKPDQAYPLHVSRYARIDRPRWLHSTIHPKGYWTTDDLAEAHKMAKAFRSVCGPEKSRHVMVVILETIKIPVETQQSEG